MDVARNAPKILRWSDTGYATGNKFANTFVASPAALPRSSSTTSSPSSPSTSSSNPSAASFSPSDGMSSGNTSWKSRSPSRSWCAGLKRQAALLHRMRRPSIAVALHPADDNEDGTSRCTLGMGT